MMAYNDPLQERGLYSLITRNISLCPEHLWSTGLNKLREYRTTRKQLVLPSDLVFMYKDTCQSDHFPKLSGKQPRFRLHRKVRLC